MNREAESVLEFCMKTIHRELKMSRFALIDKNMGRVTEVLDTDQGIPANDPGRPWLVWADAGTANVQQWWYAVLTNNVWVITEPPYEEMIDLANGGVQQRLIDADKWLMFNSLQFKADLDIATTEERVALLAHKQYCIAVSDVKKQAGYPSAIKWPVAPF